ncbi:hypothetical protein [Leisingera thetidis]|uniref:hypothetical protein n=1 Tax=Leisingera thetidis TaxID=2930199 RepID=UPI0021F7F535|nr:hypothetical protein [Leisingera thetidis]
MAETQTKKNVQENAAKAGDRAEGAAAALNDAAQMTAEKIAEAGTQVRVAAAARAQDAVQSLDGLATDSRRFVQKNPGLSLAAALGVGMLIGLAVRHRS